MPLSSHLEIEIMPGIANDGSEDFPNDDVTFSPKLFDLKTPDNYRKTIELMLDKAYKRVQRFGDEEIIAERKLIEMFECGWRKEVPGRWSQDFLSAAEELRKNFERDNDPEYKEFLRLQKKFS